MGDYIVHYLLHSFLINTRWIDHVQATTLSSDLFFLYVLNLEFGIANLEYTFNSSFLDPKNRDYIRCHGYE